MHPNLLLLKNNTMRIYKIINIVALCFFSVALNAQIIGGDAFLKNDNLELGVGSDGAFGTANEAPADYHPRPFTGATTGILGFVADADEDGWDVGTPNYCGDFFVPGAPVENLALSIGNTNYVNNSLGGYFDIPGSLSNYVSTADETSVDWNGSVAGIDIFQRIVLPTDNNYIIMTVTMTNSSESAINDIYFSRNVDPDNEATISGGSFQTQNTILSNPTTGNDQALVEAVGADFGCTVALGAVNPIAKAVYGGFSNIDAEDLYTNGSGFFTSTVGSTNYADEAIAISFNVGTLEPGEEIVLTLGYLLDPDDLDDFLVELAVGPNIQCKDIEVVLDASGNATVNASDLDDGTTDDETAPEDILFSFSATDINDNVLALDCSQVGTIDVSLYAWDAEGLVSVPCSATITVVDNILPTISCPANIVVNVDPESCGAAVTFSVTGSDNCSEGDACAINQPIANTAYSGWQGGGSSFTSCTDGSINSITIYFSGDPSGEDLTLNIFDGPNPNGAGILHSQIVAGSSLTAGANVVSLDGMVSLTNGVEYSFGFEGDNDNMEINNGDISPVGIMYCKSGSSWTTFTGWDLKFDMSFGEDFPVSCSHESGDVFPVGTTTVTCSAVDAGGNAVSCSFTVTVNDNEAPTIVCPEDIIVNSNEDICGAAVEFEVGLLDNCDEGEIGCAINQPTANTAYAGWQGGGSSFMACTDGNVQSITVYYESTPSAGDLTLRIYDSGNPNSAGVLHTQVVPGSSLAIGANTVVIDGAVELVDGTEYAFAFDGNNDGMEINSGDVSPVGIMYCKSGTSWTSFTGWDLKFDLVMGGSSITCSHESGDVFPIGTTTVNCIATDGSGNTAACSFTVTVEDNIAPIASCQNFTGALDASGSVTISVADIDDGSSDNCGIEDMFLSKTTFTCEDLGDNTVELTVSDGLNTSVCTATVTIIDETVPTFTCPDDVNETVVGTNCELTVEMPDLNVMDVCGEEGVTVEYISPEATFEEIGGVTFASFEEAGLYEVIVVVTDPTGNSSECSFIVKIEDNEPPIIDNCQFMGPIEAEAEPGCGAFVEWEELAAAKDNCEQGGENENIIITGSHAPGDWFEYGVTEVVYTATDESGNTSTCSFDVIVGEVLEASYTLNGATGLTMFFQNTSIGGDSYFWDFGDGTTSTLENPTHTFPAEGFYEVCLTIEGICNTDEVCHDMKAFFTNQGLSDQNTGQDEVSEIVTFENASSRNELEKRQTTEMIIYPNPSIGKSYLKFNLVEDDNMTINIIDRLGKQVSSVTSQYNKGHVSIALDTEQLISGVYYVQILSESTKLTTMKQLVIMN